MVTDSEIYIEAGQNRRLLNRELIRTRSPGASLDQTNRLFEDMIGEIRIKQPNLSTFELYRAIADATPAKIPNEAQQMALQAVASIDSNVSRIGKKIFLYLNLKSVLSAIDEFVEGRSVDEADEIVQEGIAGALERLDKLSPRVVVAQQVYIAARYSAALWVAATESVEVGRVLDGSYKEEGNRIITTDLDEDTINGQRYLPGEDIDFETIASEFLPEDIASAVATLTPRERRVLELRFGLDGGEKLTLNKIREEFHVTEERIRQIEAKALRKLRHPTRSEKLKVYLEGRVPRRSILPDYRATNYTPGLNWVYDGREAESVESKKPHSQWEKWESQNPLPKGVSMEDIDVEDAVRRYGEYKASKIRELLWRSVYKDRLSLKD